jgi:hypothetical protein
MLDCDGRSLTNAIADGNGGDRLATPLRISYSD